MFGKIFKYEMRATAPLYLVMFGIGLLFGLFTLLVTAPYGVEQLHSVMQYVEGGVYIIISLCSMVATLVPILFFILTAIRYNQSMYGREGYLSHSLPVSPTSLVLGKFAATAVWGVCVCFLSVFLVCSIFYNMLFPIYMTPKDTIIAIWEKASNLLGAYRFLFSVFFTIVLHISLYAHYIFLSVTLANLPWFRKWNTILSIVFFFMIQYIEGHLTRIVLRPTLKDGSDFFFSEDFMHWVYALTNVFSVENLWYMALAVIHIALTIWLVKKHTALQ